VDTLGKVGDARAVLPLVTILIQKEGPVSLDGRNFQETARRRLALTSLRATALRSLEAVLEREVKNVDTDELVTLADLSDVEGWKGIDDREGYLQGLDDITLSCSQLRSRAKVELSNRGISPPYKPRDILDTARAKQLARTLEKPKDSQTKTVLAHGGTSLPRGPQGFQVVTRAKESSTSSYSPPRSKAKIFDKLVTELISIGKDAGYTSSESPKDDSPFDENGENIRARQIGKMLNKYGETRLMNGAIVRVNEALGPEPAENLKSVWRSFY
jgi:hypothetical protein